MSDELVIAPAAIEIPEKKAPSATLVATTPLEMAAAQSDLTTWLVRKVDSIDSEISEVALARDEAKKHKWKTTTFNSIINKANVRRMFFEKILSAVREGYTIVPNFPIDVFAIRVDRESPSENSQYNIGRAADYRLERPEVLPEGEGRFVSPVPKLRRYDEAATSHDGKPVRKHWAIPTDFQNAEFPVMAAHPAVMSATAAAMEGGIFDRIGICPQTRRRGKGDPLIIGQIIESSPQWGEPKRVSFLIAWHLDMNTL